MSRGRCTPNLVAHIFPRLRRASVIPPRIPQHKVDEMGTRLETYPHKRLQGRSECKLRVGDYRVLYVKLGRIYLHYVGNRREIYKRS